MAVVGSEGAESLASKRATRSSPAPAAEEADDSFEIPEPLDGGDPSVTQSKVRARVPAGHSMIVGGHALPDGKREFAVMTPTWMPDSKLIAIEVDLLQLDVSDVAAAGLETLITGERKTQQHAEVWTPEEVARTMAAMAGETLQAKPRVITTPGAMGRITVGHAPTRFELELQATEAAEGGFDLSSELKRSE
ncbi:MAG: hypothetical protein EAZ65_08245 [Verrucomicrobia bacterium]|nr:MAG: hypothetical protein EAZ84_05870 [Verrucomicrobiota bacterium]TAE86899.1 MAG: hypothetical protein EAZ82_09615 [Verrucomicrobiota bacterium]TAF24671.1 MAG: hypothetical protein EAZ71_09840 [Verrucomicrobiota bacterium]TAF40405.1 MAG: hypothetical protein EAZ65_08245 [Verrucomicrobiota bacterium]